MVQAHGAAAENPDIKRSRQAWRAALITAIVIYVIGLLTGVAIGFAVWWLPLLLLVPLALLLRTAGKHVDRITRDLAHERRGQTGELMIASVLATLGDRYHLFHDVDVPGSGDIDHLLIGPTGVYCIDTKHWRGAVSSDGRGELLWNGRPTSKREVARFLSRVVRLREALGITREDGPFFQAVFVFPIAHVSVGRDVRLRCVRGDDLIGLVERGGRERLSEAQVRALVERVMPMAEPEPSWHV